MSARRCRPTHRTVRVNKVARLPEILPLGLIVSWLRTEARVGPTCAALYLRGSASSSLEAKRDEG